MRGPPGPLPRARRLADAARTSVKAVAPATRSRLTGASQVVNNWSTIKSSESRDKLFAVNNESPGAHKGDP